MSWIPPIIHLISVCDIYKKTRTGLLHNFTSKLEFRSQKSKISQVAKEQVVSCQRKLHKVEGEEDQLLFYFLVTFPAWSCSGISAVWEDQESGGDLSALLGSFLGIRRLIYIDIHDWR